MPIFVPGVASYLPIFSPAFESVFFWLIKLFFMKSTIEHLRIEIYWIKHQCIRIGNSTHASFHTLIRFIQHAQFQNIAQTNTWRCNYKNTWKKYLQQSCIKIRLRNIQILLNTQYQSELKGYSVKAHSLKGTKNEKSKFRCLPCWKKPVLSPSGKN